MSSLQHVHVTHNYKSSPEQVFDAMSEHENLGKVLGATVTRVRDGDSERNGAGSVRRLKPLGLPPAFEETIVAAQRPSLIEYTITKGSPMTDHRGQITFEPMVNGGTHLDYQIWFGSGVPGLAAIVKMALTAAFKRGLPKLID